MNNITDEELNKRLAEIMHKETQDLGDGLHYRMEGEKGCNHYFSYQDSDIFVECLTWLLGKKYRPYQVLGFYGVTSRDGIMIIPEDLDLKRCIALARITANDPS